MSKVIDETEVQGQVRMVTPSLPGYLFVARTKDKGRGVFTSRAISKGEVIEVCPMIVFSRKDRLYIDSTFLYEYYFEWGKNQKKGALALGFGSVYNHSYQPNARYEPDFDLNIMEFIAIRDIVAGEEITTNYNYDPEDDSPVWWEKSQGKKKKQHP
ncbi:MAG: SET domain-containing protein [Chitinophagales bacterium]|nr:SET domain-containing protein-lysine N-methyltransferase [Chitinophagales bacterium]HPE96412.1 SET domain-containing protein [Chitinophagales bacterium]HPR28913.1 SET domain-containing protein [Chitinophagales bacterium]HQU38386.1 SET domain-containing protein [Chitinophagales bacterium]HQU76794.1 SET domain-containing protein [Chitinophagales bacterium]